MTSKQARQAAVTDLRYWQNGGDSFNCHIFSLMMKADANNSFKLATVYPHLAAVYKDWCNASSSEAFFESEEHTWVEPEEGVTTTAAIKEASEWAAKLDINSQFVIFADAGDEIMTIISASDRHVAYAATALFAYLKREDNDKAIRFMKSLLEGGDGLEL